LLLFATQAKIASGCESSWKGLKKIVFCFQGAPDTTQQTEFKKTLWLKRLIVEQAPFLALAVIL
jgi:hypothetical protein